MTFAQWLAKYGLTVDDLIAKLRVLAEHNPDAATWILGSVIPFIEMYGGTTSLTAAVTAALNEFVALIQTGSGPVEPAPVDVS